MSAYDIKRWDAVTGNNIVKQPMIYIKPDETFLSFVRANKFAVMCEISGTGMNYDHKAGSSVLIPGIVSRSSVVPNCRPNYYAATSYYVVRLLAPWIGYPNKNLGQVKFFGMKEGMDTKLNNRDDIPKVRRIPRPSNTQSPRSTATSSNTNSSPDRGKIVLIVLCIVLLVILVSWFLYRILKR